MDYRQKYIASLERHIASVQEYGLKLGVPTAQLDVHDASKWSPAEFEPYAQFFYGDRSDPDGMARAWLHHIHANPHHWNHWMYTGGWTLAGADCEDGVLPMPEHYALEMVADWHGASHAYTGSWDIGGWLGVNMGRIVLHSATRRYVTYVLENLGYGPVLAAGRWAGAET